MRGEGQREVTAQGLLRARRAPGGGPEGGAGPSSGPGAAQPRSRLPPQVRGARQGPGAPRSGQRAIKALVESFA